MALKTARDKFATHLSFELGEPVRGTGTLNFTGFTRFPGKPGSRIEDRGLRIKDRGLSEKKQTNEQN